MPIPQAIFGLGGAGKEILFTLLKQDWFLDKLVNYKKDGIIDRLQAVVIDTATAEYPDDEKKKNVILERLDKILKEKEEHISATDLLDLRIICIPKVINVRRVGDLIAKDVINRIKNSDILRYDFGADDIIWWLEDERLGDGWFRALKTIDPKIDVEFAKGVFRKRAISKSLFYKYIAEGAVNFPNIKANEACAIIVGLGGGTGSGIFLDLARYLKRKGAPVELFAVLPTLNELDDEKSNAYVALSEIEFLRVNGSSYFTYVILLPFDKTEFVVSRAQDPRIKENVKQFDTVASYIFANFYIGAEIGGTDIFKELQERTYSNLMIATGAIINYDVESLYEIRQLIKDLISTIKEYFEGVKEKNEKLLGTLKELERLYGKEEKIPPKPIFDYFRSVVETLSIWNNKVFKMMRYSSTEKITDELEYRKENIGLIEIKSFDSLLNYIDLCLEVLDNVKRRTDLEPKDAIDRELPDILYEIFSELRNVGEIIRLYTNVRMDEKLRNIIENLVRDSPLTHKSEIEMRNFIESKKEEINKAELYIKELFKKIQSLEREKKSIKDTVSEFIGRLRRDLSELWELHSSKTEFSKRVNELNNSLNEFVINIVNEIKKFESSDPDKLYTGKKDKWLDKIGYNNIKGEIHKTFRDIETLSYEIENLESEVDSFIIDVLNMIYLYSLAKYYEYREKECSNSRNPFKRRRTKEYKSLKDKFRVEFDNIKSRLFDSEFGIEYLGSLPEKVDILSPVIRRFERKLNNKIEDITDEINRRFSLDINRDVIVESLEMNDKSKLIEELQETLIEKLIKKNRIKEELDELTNEIKSLENKKKNLKKVYETLTNFWKRYTELKSEIERLSDKWNVIKQNLENLNRKTEERSRLREDYIYLSKIYPDPQVMGAISDSVDLDINVILKSDILSKDVIEKEVKRIVDKCKVRISELAGDRKYHCIGHTPIEKHDNKGLIRWSPNMVSLCLNGGGEIIKRITENEEVLVDYINNGLALTEKRGIKILPATEIYSAFDIAILLYIAPLFLDNIANVGGDYGYYKSYSKRRGINIAGKFIPNILHHTLNLEKGMIIKRELINLGDAVEIIDKENERKDVSADVLRYYEEIDLTGGI